MNEVEQQILLSPQQSMRCLSRASEHIMWIDTHGSKKLAVMCLPCEGHIGTKAKRPWEVASLL